MEKQLTGLEYKIQEMAERIRALREITGLSTAEMAQRTGVSEEEYIRCESGQSDLNFAFLYRCSLSLGVDITDIIEGQSPKLRGYTVTRAGQGQKIEQAHGMVYYNMASDFRNRISEPLFVVNKYSEEAEHSPIALTSHEGQEFDLVLKGRLKVQVGEHTEILEAGDSIYYDSSTPHGMLAVDGRDCLFMAVVLPGETTLSEDLVQESLRQVHDGEQRRVTVASAFIDTVENQDGALQKISFHDEDKFNFAFDVVDALAKRDPNKLAMLHISRDMTERRFTFNDMKRASNQAANYFKSLGIKRGDRVMLVLKRHYQFWFAILGLHKLGAIAIPATNQLVEKDFVYRFQAADVNAIVCTADGDVADAVENASLSCPCQKS